MIDVECPECEKKCAIMGAWNSYSKIHKKADGKPEFCQTCLKIRIENLERLFAEKDAK